MSVTLVFYRIGAAILCAIYAVGLWRGLSERKAQLTAWNAAAVRDENPRAYWAAIALKVILCLGFAWALIASLISD